MSPIAPVAFCVFNRPEPTARVFGAIRRAAPSRLLVVSDGPRSGTDDEVRCAAVQRIIEAVDWPCAVERNAAPQNLGCRQRLATGLTWVFERVPAAIILEDDCLPHDDFFPFATELLERFSDDERVMAITGSNHVGRWETPYSYFFSRYPHIWGWASWRRAWAHYDVAMGRWPEMRDAGLLTQCCEGAADVASWKTTFDACHAGEIDTWDYQWTFACWSQSGLTATPQVNLVTNIGAGAEATHTRDSAGTLGLAAERLEFPLRHPPFCLRDAAADHALWGATFAPPPMTWRARCREARRILSEEGARSLSRKVWRTLRRRGGA